MRFLLVTPQYLPTVGGVERYNHNLALALIEQGHQVVVATSALPPLPAHEVDTDGIEVYRLPSRPVLKGRFPMPRKNAEFRGLAAQMFARPFDMVVVNNRFYLLSLWAAKQAKKRGLPALVLDHSTAHLSLGSRLIDLPIAWYEHLAMRVMRRRCPHFYGVSQACCRWLLHYGVQAKGVLYNSVDAGRLEAIARGTRRDFRSENGLGADAPLVAYSGRLVPEKGIWELLDAFELLRRRLPGAALLMAGDGVELQAVQKRNAPGVTLCGALPYEESIALLAQADVFCLPSYSEGFATTVLEATAVRTCVVTTPVGGSLELIENGVTGILLENLEPQTIADALYRALADTAWRTAAQQAAQEVLKRRFTWAITAETLAGIAEHRRRAAQAASPLTPK